MPKLTLINIPHDLYQRLRETAKANRRSIHNEIIECIERALRVQMVNPHQTIAIARKLREKTAHFLLTDEEFSHAKAEGRS